MAEIKRNFDPFPEQNLQINPGLAPPVMPGMAPQLPTNLSVLRRQQLVDLAMAFGVEEQIDVDAPKEQILPILLVLEQRGAFRGKCSRPWYLWKASKKPDELKEIPKRQFPTMASMPNQDPEKELVSGSMADLHRRCTLAGIKMKFGAKKDELLEALEKHAIGLDPTPPAAA